MKISGLIVAKNEWPLLAVTISHALTHHCDEVWLIDNASTDGTQAGIAYLNEHVWSGRIHYVHYSERFDQAAITSFGMRLAWKNGAEFILILDGDEFLITKNHVKFAGFLASRTNDPDFLNALGVQVITQNFAVPFNFQVGDLDQYLEIDTLTIPNQENVYNPVEELARKINSDEINFFDNHPWNFRAIPRADNRLFVTAGTHQLTPLLPVYYTHPDEICLAHIPLSSPKKIKSLAALPEGGVQLLVAQASENSNALDSLWRKVTMPVDGSQPNFTFQKVDWLINTLRPVVAILNPHWNVLVGDLSGSELPELGDESSFHAGVLACRAAIEFILAHP